MASSRQVDLFGHDQQDDLFGDQPTPVYHADPDKVRADLHKILMEARAAQKMPWEPTRVRWNRSVESIPYESSPPAVAK
jgi:hypothetical protein